ncbi:glycosyltransferase family 2 protein [Piscinibacter defluvii]|uniref:glycosyltransferase family 2 protein n=1 Tax=Piscinibacter defluvii TaxID=1796922 RepID=UPI00197C1567|nr:glycosyltransferase family A protein [Piscinibacter defluvii]
MASALRLALYGPPLLRLVRLLRRGRGSGAGYVDLCLQLGLAARARAALPSVPAAPPRPSLAIRLAALSGRVEEALALAQTLAGRLPDPTVPRRELDAAIACVAPLSAPAALSLIQASGHTHAALPALRLQLGDRAGAAALLAARPAPDPQRWLLWANLQDEPLRQLEGFNRFLAAHDLAPVHLDDASRPLSVGNLRASVPAGHAPGSGELLSVVMTCYDCAAYVDAALRSVLGQSHATLELIAVDDGSRDDTWQRLLAAAAADRRVRPVRLRHNVGTYAAKNVGLGLARGELLAFQDADDWSCPERFARCLSLLRRRPWVQAVTCEYVRLQDDGRFWSGLVWPLQRRTPNSVLLRRRALDRIGFFDEHRFGSDGEFVGRLIASVGPRGLHRIAQPLIVAARRENSLMTAPATGLDARGRSQVRADFQEAWTESLLQRALAGESHYRAAVQGTPALIVQAP